MGVEESHEQPSVRARLQLVRNIARALNSANNAITLYPADSPMPREAAAGFIAALDRFLMFEPYLQLAVSVDRLCLEDEDVCGVGSSVRRFAFILHTRQVGQIRFMSGLDADECVQFLRILGLEPDVLRAKGGLGKGLVAGGVSHVLVVDLAQEAAAASGGQAGLDATQVAGVVGLRDDALVSPDSSQTRAWLQQAFESVAAQGLGVVEGAAELARIVAIEADKAVSFGGADTELGLDNLSQAIGSLDETSRRGLIGSLLTGADTAAGALHSLLSRVDERELVSAIADMATTCGRNPVELLAGSGLDPDRRDRIAGKANAVMRMQTQEREPAPAAPRPRPTPMPRVPVDASLPRYVREDDNVPFSATRLAADVRQFTQEERDSLLAAPQEAQASEVDRPMITLLYLLNRARDEQAATQTIDPIVDTGLYALELGKTPTLTRGICGLRLAAERADSTSRYAQHLDEAIERLSSSEVAGAVAMLLDGETGASRVGEAVAYFASAQPSAQEAALDVLAADVSNEAKDRVQAVLKELGPRAIGTLERHVTDRRWTVAYSAVTILGGIGEARLAPALRRALGHEEPRVAEAAMRSLAAIGGTEAEEAIAWAIERGEGATRALAVELAGKMRAALAVEPLGRIVGDGDLFGRTLGEKLAAVDALGAIATPDALRVLEAAERTRFLFSPGKTRQLRERVRQVHAHVMQQRTAACPEPGEVAPGG